MPPEILSSFEKKILDVFSSIEESRAFYLTGDTALTAYHLQHRLSEDLDIFCSEEPLIRIVSEKFKTALDKAEIHAEIIRSFGSFWEAVLRKDADEIRVQLALDTPFHLSKMTQKGGILTHGLEDIAANKLLALFGRAEERDFVDIYFLVQDGHFSMEELIDMARQKDPGLDEYYLSIALERAEDLPDDVSELKLTLLRDLDLQALKMYFKQQAVRILKRGMPPRQ